jgi:hypothetical protein
MRTERVTLEERITLEFSFDHKSNFRPREWAATFLPGAVCQGISVRVVSDEEPIPPAPVSRPAETRQTQAERVGCGWWFPKCDKPSAPPPPPPAPPRVHRGSGVFDANGDEVPWEGVVAALTKERDAAIREREEAKARVSRVLKSSDSMWSQILVVGAERDKLRARVAALEAASGGGEGEAVAWGVMVGGKIDQHAGSDALFVDNEEAQEWCHDAAISNRGTVVPLYLAPPQPRGWLTEEEREMLRYASQGLREAGGISNVQAMKQIDDLLARSSPPEVVHPDCHFDQFSGCSAVHAWNICAADFRKALAAAGVAVKEVGGE